jgi:hypothetical protein
LGEQHVDGVGWSVRCMTKNQLLCTGGVPLTENGVFLVFRKPPIVSYGERLLL